MKKMRSPVQPAIEIDNLFFSFDSVDLARPLLQIEQYIAQKGSLNLLLGANGVGKSTLLRVMAGKHIVLRNQVKVLGNCPFSDPMSISDISLVSGYFPMNLDLEVAELIQAAKKKAEFGGERLLKELLALLSVDPAWRMHRVSTGQRRRVDLLLALVVDPKVLLLDEVTSDLDVLCRLDLMTWLATRARKTGMTVVLATHILDGLEKWAHQILFLGYGKVLFQGPYRAKGRFVDFVVRKMRQDLVGSAK